MNCRFNELDNKMSVMILNALNLLKVLVKNKNGNATLNIAKADKDAHKNVKTAIKKIDISYKY